MIGMVFDMIGMVFDMIGMIFDMIGDRDECQHGDAIPVSQQFAECACVSLNTAVFTPKIPLNFPK